MKGTLERAAPLDASPSWKQLCVGVLTLLVLGIVGCRPRWSQDGRQLVFTGLEDGRQVFAVHDLEANTSRKLSAIEPNDGAAHVVWDPDGARWVVAEAVGSDDKTVHVYTLDWAGKKGESHRIDVRTRNTIAMLHEPVVCGGNVFLTGEGIIRLNLSTGEVTRGTEKDVSVFPRDGGVGYVRGAGPLGQDAEWEIGEVDPVTLETTAWCKRPDDCKWQIVPHPRFREAGDRCAVVAMKGEKTMALDQLEWAILILEKDRLVSTIELGGSMAAGPVAWIDDVTVCTTIARPGNGFDTLALLETDFGGTVRHETPLLEAPVVEQMLKNFGIGYALNMPFLMEPAPSPDGKIVAITTAKLPLLPDELSGLLLVRRGESRRVDRVPFEFESK